MTTRRCSFQWGLLFLAVLPWTAALSYGQVQPTGIMYLRDASPATSASAATLTQANTVYHGGPVLPNLTTYAIWFGDLAEFPPDALTGIDQFLSGLNGSPYLAIADQYLFGAKLTTRFGGNIFYKNQPPPLPTNHPSGASGKFQGLAAGCQWRGGAR